MPEQVHMDVPPPAVTGMDVAYDDAYVAGFPVHVALTVHGDARVALRKVLYPDWKSLEGAVGLTLLDPAADAGHQVALRVDAAPRVDEESTSPRSDVPPGGVLRMLVDLSEIVGAARNPPAPGAFHARITYAGSPSKYLQRESGFALVLRAPTASEAHVLGALAPEVPRGWGQWTKTPPKTAEEGALLTSRIAPTDPLRFLRVMRFLMFGPVELRDVDLTTFDVLRGVYAPEAEALRAEVLAARGDPALAAHLAKVSAATPGLEPWLSSIERGMSYIAWVREHIRR